MTRAGTAIDGVGMSLPRLIACRLRRRPLVIRAWFQVAAESTDLNGKRRCIEGVLPPDPNNETA